MFCDKGEAGMDGETEKTERGETFKQTNRTSGDYVDSQTD